MNISYFLKIYLFGSANKRVPAILKAASWCNKKGYNRLEHYFHLRLERDHGVFISPKAKIDESVSFPHPVGIVIGAGVIVKKNVVIYQGVTLGAARMGESTQGLYPVVEDDCVLYAGATVIGQINIGKNTRVGTNSVLLHSTPENSVVAGVPALDVRKGFK